MKTRFHANMCDISTKPVATAMVIPFQTLSHSLSGEYGGIMEHLWIDLELIVHDARPDGKPRYPFRFQKRVSGRSHFGLSPIQDHFNVGHYSVRPNFQIITSLSTEQLVPYVLTLIYHSTSILLDKQKRLGGFDAMLFSSRFMEASKQLGHDIIHPAF